MQTLKSFVFITFALLFAACSQTDDIQEVGLEPQLGPPHTIDAKVAVGSVNQTYTLTQRYHGFYDDEGTEILNRGVDLSHYSPNGNLLWERELYDYTCDAWDIDECEEKTVYPLDVTTDGVGNAYTLNYIYQEACDHSSEYYYVDLRKFNRSGTELWSHDVTNAVAFTVDSDGNIYTVGNNDTGYGDYCDEGDDDPPFAHLIRKYNPTGSLVWERPFAPDIGYPIDIAVASNGNIFVAGYDGLARHGKTGGVWWQKSGGAEEIIASGSTIVTRSGLRVRKFNHSGTQLWSRFIGGFSGASVAQMDSDTNGNVYVAGNFSTSSRSNDAFVRKLNSSGTPQWTKSFGTSQWDSVGGIGTYSSSAIYVAGSTYGRLSPANHQSNAFLYKMNGQGNRVWVR